MSSAPQEASPAQQREAVAKLAKDRGYKLIREYFDGAVSGNKTAKRKDFLRMIADVEEKGDFCAILCWDQDRFGRFDSIEAGRWIHPLREAGVWLVTVEDKEVDWNDFASRITYSVKQEGKHQFLMDLSKNVLRGKIASAKKGQGANISPYGFDRVYYDESGAMVKRLRYGERFTKPKGWQKRFVIAEDGSAEIVRRIFKRFADSDAGYATIAAELNAEGITSPNGGVWCVQTIQQMLKRRTYTGANVFGGRPEGEYHYTDGNGEIAKGKARQKNGSPIVVEGVHEQLIPIELFDRVQRKIAGRAHSTNRPRTSDYVLTGVLRCGHCGGTLAGKGYPKNPEIPKYYTCTNGQTKPGTCCRYQIPQREIERYILGVIEKRILAPRAIAKVKQAVLRRARSKKVVQNETKSLRTKIEALDRKISKGSENLLLASPEHIDDLSRMLGGWKSEREQLQMALERAATNPDGMTPEKLAEQAGAELRRLAGYLKSHDPMKLRGVVKAMVEEVRLWWEPYGKNQKRFVQGEIRFRNNLEVLSTVSRGR